MTPLCVCLDRCLADFLYREEKVVEGPTLRPRNKVQEIVIGAPEVEAEILAEAERRLNDEGLFLV